jgi:hypothetical protein
LSMAELLELIEDEATKRKLEELIKEIKEA